MRRFPFIQQRVRITSFHGWQILSNHVSRFLCPCHITNMQYFDPTGTKFFIYSFYKLRNTASSNLGLLPSNRRQSPMFICLRLVRKSKIGIDELLSNRFHENSVLRKYVLPHLVLFIVLSMPNQNDMPSHSLAPNLSRSSPLFVGIVQRSRLSSIPIPIPQWIFYSGLPELSARKEVVKISFGVGTKSFGIGKLRSIGFWNLHFWRFFAFAYVGLEHKGRCSGKDCSSGKPDSKGCHNRQYGLKLALEIEIIRGLEATNALDFATDGDGSCNTNSMHAVPVSHHTNCNLAPHGNRYCMRIRQI